MSLNSIIIGKISKFDSHNITFYLLIISMIGLLTSFLVEYTLFIM